MMKMVKMMEALKMKMIKMISVVPTWLWSTLRVHSSRSLPFSIISLSSLCSSIHVTKLFEKPLDSFRKPLLQKMIASYMFPGICCEADDVEVALDEVDDHILPHILFVFCRCVVSEILMWLLILCFCCKELKSQVFGKSFQDVHRLLFRCLSITLILLVDCLI